MKYIGMLKYENNDKGYILEADVEYPKNLFNFHSDLPFLLQRKKIDQRKLCCGHKSFKISIKSWINT